jgi:hypothetical protein
MRAWWLIVMLLIFTFGVVSLTVVMITLIPARVMFLDRFEELSRRFGNREAP